MGSPVPSNASPIVIGAGITGLVRALELVKQGRHPIIIDPNLDGGLVRSETVDGFSLELGATTLVMTEEVRLLIDMLGLNSRVRYPAIEKYKQYVWHDGAVREVPRGPIALLRSGLFSFREKAIIIRGLFRKAPALFRSGTPTVHELFSGIFSSGITARVVAPVLRGIYGGDIHKLLAPYVFPKLWQHLQAGGTLFQYAQQKKALGRRSIFIIDGGNSTLTAESLKKLQSSASVVRASVTGLQRSGDGGFTVSTSTGNTVEGSEVHISSSGGATAEFLSPIAPGASALLSAVRYAPITVVHVAASTSQQLPDAGFGVLFPKPSDVRSVDDMLLGILFNSQLFPHVAPQGHHLLTVCFGGVGGESIQIATDNEILAAMQRCLQKHLSVLNPRILKITRWNRAIPQYEADMPQLAAALKNAEQTQRGLFFIGADLGGPGVPARVEAAQHPK